MAHSDRHLCSVAVILLALFACLFRLGAPTLEVWDEARLANSALEMLGNGRWLTPHFDGAPDHWSTKPPLVIWMMAFALDTFGTSDWAARLPAAMCGVALIVGVHAWVSRVTGAPMTGVAAALCLACTPGFLLEHGARAAEYDVPLTLSMLGCLYATHRWTESPAGPRWAPALFAACLLAGVMIKTVQALVILPALALWWITRRPRPSLVQASVIIPGMAAVLAAALYIVLRHADDPGYLAATWYNDIAGRFTEPQEGHSGDALWYVRRLRGFPLLLPGFVAWLFVRRRHEPTLTAMADLLALVLAWYLLVISLAQTKLTWYAIPTAPLSAMLVALGIRAVWRSTMRDTPGAWLAPADARVARRRGMVVLMLGCLTATVYIAYRIEEREDRQQADPTHGLDHLLRAPALRLPKDERIAVIQPGIQSPHSEAPYVAPTLFYVRALRLQGWTIDLIHSDEELRPEHHVVIRCAATQTSVSNATQVVPAEADCAIHRRMPAAPTSLESTAPPPKPLAPGSSPG